MLLLHQEMEGDRRLELIDDLQRLAISHHFEQEITQILSSIYHDDTTERDLYSTSLQFRLLREHGFRVSQGACYDLLYTPLYIYYYMI